MWFIGSPTHRPISSITRFKRSYSTRPGVCRARSFSMKCCQRSCGIRAISTVMAMRSMQTARKFRCKCGELECGCSRQGPYRDPPEAEPRQFAWRIEDSLPECALISTCTTRLQKSYFKRDMRALSHGCIRLERPRDMAAAVLGTSVKNLDKYFGKDERGIKVPEPVPCLYCLFYGMAGC